jgi:hypothetical protein
VIAVAGLAAGREEVGLIGCEGMTGLAVVMGHDRSPCETYMQVAGTGGRIIAEHLRRSIGRSARLHQVLLQYAHSFYMETTQTAVSNMRGTSNSASLAGFSWRMIASTATKCI